MKYELKRIDPWSAVKITFVISGVLGVFAGAFYAVLITVIASFVGTIGMSEEVSREIGHITRVTGFIVAIAWIVITILCAVLGAIAAGLSSWLYNLVSGVIGGVNLTLEPQPTAVTENTSVPPTTVMPVATNGDNQTLQ